MRGDSKHVSMPHGNYRKTTLSTKKILLYPFVALSMYKCHPVLIKLLRLQHKWISFAAAGLVVVFCISSASSCGPFKGNLLFVLFGDKNEAGWLWNRKTNGNSLSLELGKMDVWKFTTEFPTALQGQKNYLYFSSPNAIKRFPAVSNIVLY